MSNFTNNDTSKKSKKLSLDFFLKYKKENIWMIVVMIVIAVILTVLDFKHDLRLGFTDVCTEEYVVFPSIAFGVIGFFWDMKNIWLQRFFKLLAFPSVLFILFALVVMIVLGGGALAGVDFSPKVSARQSKIDLAASKMKTAAHNKAVADSLIHSGDKHVSANAKIHSAHAEGDYNEALADLLAAKTGNTSAASKMKTAAHNKAVADSLIHSGDKHVSANARYHSAQAEGELNSALADLLSNLGE